MTTQPNISPETISHGSVNVTLEPEVGGMITSLEIDGVQALYQDMYEKTLFKGSKSVKGGIPYMFPNAGPILEEETKKSGIDLPQHGIARRNPWELTESNQDEGIVKQRFTFNESEGYKYEGNIVNTIQIIKNGIDIIHNIHNNSDRNMPISSGLHPYFRVPEGNKSDIKWEFEGGKKVAEAVTEWSDDGTITFNNPKAEKPFSIIIPGLGRLQLTASKDYKKFWVWSLPKKDFVCIEPVMGDEGAIANSPVIVEPNETNKNSLKIELFQH